MISSAIITGESSLPRTALALGPSHPLFEIDGEGLALVGILRQFASNDLMAENDRRHQFVSFPYAESFLIAGLSRMLWAKGVQIFIVDNLSFKRRISFSNLRSYSLPSRHRFRSWLTALER
jgi:hypothetical protein